MPQINRSNIRDLPRPTHLNTAREYALHQNGFSKAIKSFELASTYDDETISEWALHIRRHYIRDDQLSDSTCILPPEEYLRTLIIPDRQTTRTGDFGEIIVSDVIEHNEGYVVPRYKQFDRDDRNMSGHGVDIVAYKINSQVSPKGDDTLLLIEVKSSRKEQRVSAPLREAKSEYRRNLTRRAMSVENIRRRASMHGDKITANEITRFQNIDAVDFQELNGYAIVISVKDVQAHINRYNTQIKESEEEHVYVVHREQLGRLIDEIYERCTK